MPNALLLLLGSGLYQIHPPKTCLFLSPLARFGSEKSAKPSSLCSTAVSCKFCPSLCFERQKVKPPWLSAQNPWSFSRVKNEPPFSFCSLYLNSLHEHEWMDSASGFRLVRRSYISHWRQGGKGAESQIKPPKSKLGNGQMTIYTLDEHGSEPNFQIFSLHLWRPRLPSHLDFSPSPFSAIISIRRFIIRRPYSFGTECE